MSINTWKNIRGIVSENAKTSCLKDKSYYCSADAREILDEIPKSVIDCVITSPPYGNLKNYGSKKQLGYGQDQTTEYFPDIDNILKELYRVLKSGSSMWMVVDNIKLNGKTIALPWEIIGRANRIGWQLQDVIVWDKGKSLPWSHKGRFRNVCEFILLFSKGKLNKFNLDAARDSEFLSSYWVKYPERFHPDGKSPSDLWHFPIPIQGSWAKGKEVSRHYCPFPVELIARMLMISTKKNDVVIDPFSGTGSVLATASFLDRYSIGFDVNNNFISNYNKSGYKQLLERCKELISKEDTNHGDLRKIIVDLRILKYAKILFSQIARADRFNGDAREQIISFIVNPIKLTNLNNKIIDTNNLGKISIDLLAKKGADLTELKNLSKEFVKNPPLSKYGFDVDIHVISERVWKHSDYLKINYKHFMYLYTKGIFYKYEKRLPPSLISEIICNELNDNKHKIPPILSRIKAETTLPINESNLDK